MAMPWSMTIWMARMVLIALSGWVSSCLTVADDIASSIRSGDIEEVKREFGWIDVAFIPGIVVEGAKKPKRISRDANTKIGLRLLIFQRFIWTLLMSWKATRPIPELHLRSDKGCILCKLISISLSRIGDQSCAVPIFLVRNHCLVDGLQSSRSLLVEQDISGMSSSLVLPCEDQTLEPLLIEAKQPI
ncbi:hypothetical protein RJ641_027107 [Dillenia turbinata]|uniref:Uncharacterized protein n=1 Tax=Dillenia turbinata TaxID=194707 RepID=A0AAN8ZPZ9_9MAGN